MLGSGVVETAGAVAGSLVPLEEVRVGAGRSGDAAPAPSLVIFVTSLMKIVRISSPGSMMVSARTRPLLWVTFFRVPVRVSSPRRVA